MNVTLLKPSVFAFTGGVCAVDIYPTGEPFYHIAGRRPGDRFTLPPGRYSVFGARFVKELRAKPQRRIYGRPNFRLPEGIEIVKAPNKNKATVFPQLGVIVADPSLWELPVPCRAFVLFHELGHYWHSTEEGADRWAAREMKRQGFNPSQIAFGAKYALTHHSEKRSNKITEQARKMRSPK